jgi:hypothetical protein
VGLNSSSGTTLGSASSVATDGSSSLGPKALGCSSVKYPVSSVHASSSPPKVSSPVAVLEKFSAAVPQRVALGCSSVVVPSFFAAELLYPPPVDVGFSMGCSSGVGLHLNSFLSSEELSSASLIAYLRSEGFSPEPVGIVGGSESFGATFPGVVALGERLRLSCLVISKCKAPIYLLDSKQVQRYYRKAKKGNVAQVDASLIAKVVAAINVPIV